MCSKQKSFSLYFTMIERPRWHRLGLSSHDHLAHHRALILNLLLQLINAVLKLEWNFIIRQLLISFSLQSNTIPLYKSYHLSTVLNIQDLRRSTTTHNYYLLTPSVYLIAPVKYMHEPSPFAYLC